MEKVRTNVAVSYDAKNTFKTAIIEIVLNRWLEQGENFIAEITHNKIEVVTNDEQSYEQKFPIYNSSIKLDAEKINALSNALQAVLPSGLSEVDYRKVLKQQALLLYVQTDWIDENESICAYNTLPSNWVIYTEPVIENAV